MKIAKSTRHSKITGDFAEGLVMYWLSKYGFECARVDHTGIDLIARNPHTNEVMGISVKSRSRNTGTEGTTLAIPNENFEKADRACKAFGCVPYFAIVVDAGDTIRVFILRMDRLLELSPPKQNQAYWRMTKRAVAEHCKDPTIMCFDFKATTTRWWA